MTAKMTTEAVAASTDKRNGFTPSPIVVSEKAEALSHSDTTMKLIPSFELFQLLPEKEGGVKSLSAKRHAEEGRSIARVGAADDQIREVDTMKVSTRSNVCIFFIPSAFLTAFLFFIF